MAYKGLPSTSKFIFLGNQRYLQQNYRISLLKLKHIEVENVRFFVNETLLVP
jgi:hypothetical protein